MRLRLGRNWGWGVLLSLVAAHLLALAIPACGDQESVPELVCQPRSVAACLGPEGCEGGQTCRADGSGHEECDCSPGASPLAADTNCLASGSTGCSLSERCCSGAACVAEDDTMVCRPRCTSGSDCETGCCTPWDNVISVCSAASRCMPAQSCRVGADCATRCCSTFLCAPSSVCGSTVLPMGFGVSLFAEDATFLGDASSDASLESGVCNPSGAYGSASSATSIFNPNGVYGSPASALSAYDPQTFTPPFLYDTFAGEFIAWVSKNVSLELVIDPDALCAFLAQEGL